MKRKPHVRADDQSRVPRDLAVLHQGQAEAGLDKLKE